MVVTIDGPAGAGKSTVAKRIARTLGLMYLDTGAMYRAFTLHVLKKNIPLDDLPSIERSLEGFNFAACEEGVYVDGEDVTREIRSRRVDETVSYISSLALVRKKMVELQRRIGENKDIVVEGRDIGTVVFPNAEYKFYLDASVEERARRRIGDEKNEEKGVSLGEMIEYIEKRDICDSTREIAPLAMAGDAHFIDSTGMTIDEVCDYIITHIKEHRPGAALNGKPHHA